MSDDDIRDLHGRLSRVREREGVPPDHYYVCVMISDLGSLPFDRVFEACAEL
jgi:hypothetical protein